MQLEIEREKERVFGACGGKCGEAPCIEWNKQRAERQAACDHPRLNEEGMCQSPPEPNKCMVCGVAIEWELGSTVSKCRHHIRTVSEAEPAPDVVQAMQQAYVRGIKESDHDLCKQNTDCCTHGMTAAYQVARPVIEAECDKQWEKAIREWALQVGTRSMNHGLNRSPDECVVEIRAHLSQPKERVTMQENECEWVVRVLPKGQTTIFPKESYSREAVDKFVAGLRAELEG